MLSLLLLTLLTDAAPSRLAVISKAPDFSLITQEEKKLGAADLNGKIALVGFIFTKCSGACPATTHRMAAIQQELNARGLGKGGAVQLLCITLDPARDKAETLKSYMRLYDLDPSNWTFLTGEPEAVKRVINAWGMWARPAANGQLDHPSRVYLVDSLGRVREIYNLTFLKPGGVCDDIKLLLNEQRHVKP